MKPSTLAALLTLCIPTLTVAQGVEQQLKKLEVQWGEAEVKKDLAALGQIMADDFTNISPEGDYSSKSEAIASIKSGDDVVSSYTITDVKVRVYGDTAVVTYLANVRETFKGRDVSGTSRWTDTWVKRGSSWQCVASHGSKIAKQ